MNEDGFLAINMISDTFEQWNNNIQGGADIDL